MISVGLGVYFVNLVRPLGVCARGKIATCRAYRDEQIWERFRYLSSGGNTHIEEFWRTMQ